MRATWSKLLPILFVVLVPNVANAQEECTGLVRFEYRYLEVKGKSEDGAEWTRVERTLGMCADAAMVNSVRGSIDALKSAIDAGTVKVVSISDKAASIGGRITNLTGDALVLLASGAKGAWQYVVPTASAAQTCQPEQIDKLAPIIPQPVIVTKSAVKKGRGKLTARSNRQPQRTAQRD